MATEAGLVVRANMGCITNRQRQHRDFRRISRALIHRTNGFLPVPSPSLSLLTDLGAVGAILLLWR